MLIMEDIIFIPGLGESEKTYTHQLSHLSDLGKLSVFTYDEYDTTDAIRDALLAGCAAKTTLVGHSMGGYIAQKCAIQKPELIDNLILINTWANRTPEFVERNEAALQALDSVGLEAVIRHETPLLFHPSRSDLVEPTVQELLKKTTDIYRGHFKALRDAEDLQASLPKITAKTLVIHGRQDPLFTLDQHQLMATLIAAGSLAIIEDAGHCCPTERPQSVTSLIRYFLNYHGGIHAL